MKSTGKLGRHFTLIVLGVIALFDAQLANAEAVGSVSLPGHVLAVSSGATYLGAVAASQQISLSVALPLRNQAGLEDLLGRLYDPHDSLYGKYLTPSAFADAFGATQADYDSVKSYLQSKGLAVTKEFSNRLLVCVSGPASAVQSAFNVNILEFQSASGRIFHSIDTEPSVPADIAPKIQAILGLDTSFTLHPNYKPVAAIGGQLPNNFGGQGHLGSFGPADVRSAYNLSASNLTAAGLPATLNGAGQAVALVEFGGGYLASDIATYTSTYSSFFGSGYTAPLKAISIDGYNTSVTGANYVEATLDIDCVLNVANKLTKLLVFEGLDTGTNAYNLVDCLSAIATDITDTGTGRVADIVSVSYGGGEDQQSIGSITAENTSLKELAAQGQTVFCSTGDTGAFEDYDFTRGLNVIPEDPSSQPLVTAVGGTNLAENSSTFAWSIETVWNNSGIFSNVNFGTPDAGIGGGGISTIWPITNYQSRYIPTSNTSGYSKTMRNVPDVALLADPNHNLPYGIYTANAGGWYYLGGTSAACPTWAGFMSLVNQERIAKGTGDIGFANYTLYNLASGSRYSTDFHDITSGNIGLPGTPVYSAATGYDLTSGWGSFIGANLMSDLVNQVVPIAGSTYVLWNGAGTASLWKIPASGATSTATFSIASGWTPAALTSDTSGNAYILWTTTAGAASVYKVSPSLSLLTSQAFGPFAGWMAQSIAVGPDSHVHILWNHPSDNEISIYNSVLGSSTTSSTYGPYSGWQAQQIAMDSNNNTRVIWTNASTGSGALWNITSAGVQTSQSFGPYSGWLPLYLAVGSDNLARIIWENTSTKQASIYTVATGSFTVTAGFGPFTGWAPIGLAVNTDNDIDLIWNNTSNQLALYDIASPATYTTVAYGPYTGWQAIAVAAGP